MAPSRVTQQMACKNMFLMFSGASKKYKDMFKTTIPPLLVSIKCMALNTKIRTDTKLDLTPCPFVDAQTIC